MLNFIDGIKKLYCNLHKKRINKITRRIVVNANGKCTMMFYPKYAHLDDLEPVQDILVKYGLDNVLDMQNGEYIINFSKRQFNKWSDELLSDVFNNLEKDARFIKTIDKMKIKDSEIIYLPKDKKEFDMLNKIFEKYGIIFKPEVMDIPKQERVEDSRKKTYEISILTKDYNKIKDSPAIKDLEHYVLLMNLEHKTNLKKEVKTR